MFIPIIFTAHISMYVPKEPKTQGTRIKIWIRRGVNSLWSCKLLYIETYTNTLNPKHHIRVTRRVPDPSPYRKAICKIMSKLGDILTAGRRRSWVGMPLYETSPRGLYFYSKLKEILLYGRTFKGTIQGLTDNKQYYY